MDKRKLSLDTTLPQDFNPPADLVADCKSLTELADVFGSDKGSLKHNYTVHYESTLGHLANKENVEICEIGVACGASLKMWATWLPSAKITGVDIRPECKSLCSDYSNIRIVIINPVEHRLDCEFDVIVDDGSHVSKDILMTFSKNFSLVKPGGYYIIEDLVCTYSESYKKGFTFQKPVEDFDRKYFLTLLDAVMREADKRSGSSIESIIYYKELMIIKKADPLT